MSDDCDSSSQSSELESKQGKGIYCTCQEKQVLGGTLFPSWDEVEVMEEFKCLGAQLNSRLDWSHLE